MELQKVRQMLVETKKQEKELAEELASVRQEKARLLRIQDFLIADRDRKVKTGELIPLREFSFKVLEWGSMGYGSSFPTSTEQTEEVVYVEPATAAQLLMEKPVEIKSVGLSPTPDRKVGYELVD